MINKTLLLSAVKDMWLNDSYDEYSIGDGYTAVRNEIVEDWEDEGFSIMKDGEVLATYCVAGLADEEQYFFALGDVLSRMVELVGVEE